MAMTWHKAIEEEMGSYQESWEDVQSLAREEGMDIEFDNGYGSVEGSSFTVWTALRVYFPACYDGAEWCGSVSRHPDGRATSHIGGG